MIIDGKKIAEDIKLEIKAFLKDTANRPTLGVVWVGEYPVSLKYINKKISLGESLGIPVKVFKFDEQISEEKLKSAIITLLSEVDGAIVQLPLPKHLDTQKILDLIPKEKDVDCLSEDSAKGEILSPVVGAVKEILDRSGLIDIKDKKVVIVGKGKLVGGPVALWMVKNGADVKSFSKDDSENMFEEIKKADILILSAGVPGLIKQEMIKDGVILIDASTSEVSGVLKGDAEEACASKCSVFTPVPGGVGPITVVMLFKNLIELWEKRVN